MRRLLVTLTVVAVAQVLAAQTKPVSHEPPFAPAEARSITDLTVPYASIASGTVVLDALVSESGTVQRIEVRRSIASLTEPAVSAVEKWKFSPATFAGKPIPSRVPVALSVRPAVNVASPIPLPTLEDQTDAAIQAEFQPARVLHAAFPDYTGFFNPVTVVLETTLSATGEVKGIKVLRDVPPATQYATDAVGKWRFIPATWNGHPVVSGVILAFVFRPPIEH